MDHCYLKATIEARKKKFAEKKEKKKHKKGGHHDDDDDATEVPPAHPFVSQSRRPKDADSSPDSADFEEAIKTSVAATSKGDPEQDAMIEKAIRASIIELQSAKKEGDDKDAMQRAIQASVAEAARTRKAQAEGGYGDAEHSHDKEIELALQRSISEHPDPEQAHPLAGVDFDDSGIDTDDDENIKAAIERSKSMSVKDPDVEVPADEDLQKAVEASKKEYEKGLSKEKTEDEIVMEYTKKQNLLEEEHRKNIAEHRKKVAAKET